MEVEELGQQVLNKPRIKIYTRAKKQWPKSQIDHKLIPPFFQVFLKVLVCNKWKIEASRECTCQVKSIYLGLLWIWKHHPSLTEAHQTQTLTIIKTPADSFLLRKERLNKSYTNIKTKIVILKADPINSNAIHALIRFQRLNNCSWNNKNLWR